MTSDEAGTAAIDRTAVECEIHIAAPPETVFSFFTDPEKMVRWMGIAADLDARPGGLYRVDINGRDVARGEYVVVEPPSRVVIAFGWEGEDENPVPPGSTTLAAYRKRGRNDRDQREVNSDRVACAIR